MTRHTAVISRAGLILIGFILLGGGGVVLVRGLGVFPEALGSATAPLLSDAQVRYPTEHAWVWPVTAAVAAVIALLALWWLVAQTPVGSLRRLSVEPDRSHGVTVLPADAVTGAVVDEVEGYPGVQRATAALWGSPADPELRLTLTAEDQADPALLRARVETEALAHVRTALDLDDLPTVLRIRFTGSRSRHLV